MIRLFLAQVGGPTITGADIAAAVGVVGMALLLLKLGAVFGKMNGSLETMERTGKAFTLEVRDGFTGLNKRLEKLAESFNSRELEWVSVMTQVKQHEERLRMLERFDRAT